MSEVDGGDGAGASMGRPKLRVALYGGSFDPPHQCHVLVATWALCRGGVDEVWLVPALGHAFGKRLTPFETRCRMAAAAVAHLGPRVRVEPIEGRLPAPSYTVDTVRAILSESAERAEADVEVTLVMGADAYAERERWKAWGELEALVGGRVLVVGRGEADGNGAPNEAFTLPDLSSTEIRRRVAAGEPYWWMVPEPVMAIIESDGLYLAPAAKVTG